MRRLRSTISGSLALGYMGLSLLREAFISYVRPATAPAEASPASLSSTSLPNYAGRAYGRSERTSSTSGAFSWPVELGGQQQSEPAT